ncbi:TonB-dependent receptor [Sphingomonas sp. C3-2]|uniref:TonB-dependent receptor n=1 Tax=Sphingomonas sp. C3-2 TaxID=3062169 RepID=UPI00294B4BD5|nr:TonB-dependent receptor [Sphingomonas sp. C3-2]WOK35270.1 TonB-dependent receptor [Sphingomonas sp. C3-2]
MSKTLNVSRPASLRLQSCAATLALGLVAATAATPAAAQEAEVELDTLKIKDRTSDTNPYTQEGAPYKARVSGDARRVKPLVETPTTITVITESQIKESGQTDLRAILNQQPGVTIGTGENGNAFGDRYIIRGQEARSDVFVDGLRDPGMTIRESFAIEQVELTKGPSSTFAGRGSAGGAVNGITKRASTEYNFNRAELGAGTDNFIRGTIDSNWKLTDTLAARVNLLYSYQEVPDRDPADRKRWGGAVSTVFTPTDTLQILLDYYHLTARDLPDMGVYLDGTTGKPVKTPVYAQEQDFLKSDVDTFTGRIILEPFDGFSIQNATRYGTTDNGYVTTGYRGTTLSTHQGWQDVEYFVNQFNVNGEFTTGSMKHNLIVGTEYSDQKVTNGIYTNVNTGTPNCGTGYCIKDAAGNYYDNINTLMGREITKGRVDSKWHVKTLSAYIMDTVDFTDWLTVFAGLRYDALDYSNTTIANNGTRTPYGYSEELWNGHAGISVKPTENGNIYFSWGTAKDVNGGESDLGSSCGYGGICVPSVPTGTSTAAIDYGQPETVQNLELGVKWDLFNDRLMLSAAAFEITKDDVFEQAIGNTGYDLTGTLNTGRNRVRGVELGMVGNITERLSGQAGVTFMKSKILRSNNPANIGEPLANFANNAATAQLRYQATSKFSFGGTATYRGKMHAGQPDGAGSLNRTVPSSTVFDLFASYKFNENFDVRFNAGNITDKDYYLAAYRSGSFIYKGDARSFRLTVGARF